MGVLRTKGVYRGATESKVQNGEGAWHIGKLKFGITGTCGAREEV